MLKLCQNCECSCQINQTDRVMSCVLVYLAAIIKYDMLGNLETMNLFLIGGSSGGLDVQDQGTSDSKSIESPLPGS